MKILNIIRNRAELLHEGGRLYALEKEYLKVNLQGYKRSLLAALLFFFATLIVLPVSIMLIIFCQLVLPELAVGSNLISLMTQVMWGVSLFGVFSLIAAIAILASLKYQLKSMKAHFGI